MELRYVGPHDGVEVVLTDGGTKTVPFNGKLEVTGEQAEELLARPDWQRWTNTSEKTTSSTGKEG